MSDKIGKLLRGCLAGIILFVLCLSLSGRVAKAEETGKPPELIASNDTFNLYLKEDILGLVIEEKDTGYTCRTYRQDSSESMNDQWKGFSKSGIVVEVFNGRSPTPEFIDAINGAPDIRIERRQDGFDAVLSYEKQRISLRMCVRLTKQGVDVSVPADSIEEQDVYKLSAIYLCPFFGAMKGSEKDGYMVVPEGAGALIDLKDHEKKYSTPYIKRIYGDNDGTATLVASAGTLPVREPEKITAPIFGMTWQSDERGFLGIASKGAESAEIHAYPNGVITEYSWVGVRFIYREKYNMQMSKTQAILTVEEDAFLRDIEVKFILADEEHAGYSGLAVLYREYLLENGLLSRAADQYRIKIDLFGSDRKKWLLFDKAVPMTTIAQADDMLEELLSMGVREILPVYKGWQKGGITKSCGSLTDKVDAGVGSAQKLKELAEKLAKEQIPLFLEQNALHAYSGRAYNTSKDVVKQVSQILLTKPTGKKPFESMYYLSPARSGRLLEIIEGKYTELGVGGYAVSELPGNLFSYYSGGKVFTRGETAAAHAEAVAGLPAGMRMLEAPNSYLWQYMDYYYDMPLGTSNYAYLAAEVPFLPIVLKGYVPYWSSYINFEPNEEKNILKMLEYGAYPSFLMTWEDSGLLKKTNSSDIYSSQFSVLKDKVKEYYEELTPVFKKIEGVPIKRHSIRTEGTACVEYENGVEIRVNYTGTEQIIEGVKVAANAYDVR